MKHDCRIKSVATYAIPRYPTREGVTGDPSVLGALPARWGARPAVCMALPFTLSSGLAGCRVGSWWNPSGGGEEIAKQIVPVFTHGGGIGVYGCDSVTPPVFLSEEEAQFVIREEAERRGVRFTEAREIQGDRFPVVQLGDIYSSIPDTTWSGTISLDGYDPALGIGFEFVSGEDLREWNSGLWSSIIARYDFKGTAERLAEAVPGTAVFYDPGRDEEDPEFIMTRDHLIEDLRAQVRDFLDWLAAQGVI
ncbi:MAG: hypothetical protein KBA30_09590 [Clostridia bacterium]|nr:hypothetical protein [Clostridia bacterium]